MPTVRLSTGETRTFPDSMNKEEIKASLMAEFRGGKQSQQKTSEPLYPSLFDPTLGKELVARTAEIGSMFPKALSKLTGGLYPEPKERNFREIVGLPEPQDTKGLIASMAPDVAISLALPGYALQTLSKIPKVGGALSRIMGQILPQAGYSALTSQGDSTQAAGETAATMLPFELASELAGSKGKTGKRLAKLLGGAGGAYVGHEIGGIPGAVIGGVAGKSMVGRGPESLVEGLNVPQAEERLAASKRLGLDYLTPAEAGLDPFIAAQQGQLGKTQEGAKRLYERGQERVASEEKAISKLLNDIYEPTVLEPKVKEAYKEAYKGRIGGNDIFELMQNNIIEQGVKDVYRNPAYREALKNIPMESVGYWDNVKRAIDDRMQKAIKAGSNQEARELRKTKDLLVNKLDAVAPEYKEARRLAEREKIREKLEKVFDKKEISGNTFYKNLEKESEFNKLVSRFEDMPEIQQSLKDMRTLFKDLISPPSVRTAAKLEQTSMTKERNPIQALKNELQNLFNRNDENLVNFITSPDWIEQLNSILESNATKQQKIQSALQTLSRGAAITQRQLRDEQ